jgi:hypothetical protein
MEALETRVRGLVDVVQELKRSNAVLQGELRAVRIRLQKQEEQSRRWQRDRIDLRHRIQKVLADLQILECLEDSKEVARDENVGGGDLRSAVRPQGRRG